MKTRLLMIPVLALAASSCDKAKDIASKAASALKDEVASRGGKAAEKVDEELAKLVDETDEGVVFRKDLPFPKRIEVTTTRKSTVSGRSYQTSEIGQSAGEMNGNLVVVTKLERAGEQARYTLVQSSLVKPTPEDAEGLADAKDSLKQLAPPSRPITFSKKAGGWVPEGTSTFRELALSKQLAPSLETLLIENGLAPRPLWFGKKRFKVGDTLQITGESAKMLLAAGGKGSYDLKFEGTEAVNGHPCGVFSVKGDYRLRNYPDAEGNPTDADVTILSGRLWLSLIHPVVLREELDTVQTFKSGGRGGLMKGLQGSVKVDIRRAWSQPSK